MKRIKTKLLLFFITVLSISCSNDNEDSVPVGLNDFSGNFKLSFVATDPQTEVCSNESINTGSGSISSPNDLEITSTGRFKQKVYSLDSNNECIVSEIVEGQITITGTFHESPFGTIEYDNADKTATVTMSSSTAGKHNVIGIHEKIDNTVFNYTYRRSN